MQKMLMVLMVALVSSNSSAFEDLRSTPKETFRAQNERFLDAADQVVDEYTHKEDALENIDEYDQNVTDNVQPPTISPAKALLTEILGSLLVRYISMRETMRIYFQDLKQVLNKWYHLYIAKV
ncbi:MAG TPA: hypothetical protein VJJ26_01435 [Candidatus Babeliales bacterium]|nr:hypothetical protein [Candidatus Babeliales bacterium]